MPEFRPKSKSESPKSNPSATKSAAPRPKADSDLALVAKTQAGLEAVLADELRALGARNVEPLRRAVAFRGDKGFVYKANLCLRSALRILVPFIEFEARDPDDLYRKAEAFGWSELLSADSTFAISFTVHSEVFTHGQFAAQRLKDAIVDRIRKDSGRRPSVDKAQPEMRFDLMIAGNRVVVSLDSSGDSLHRRGYRSETGMAPLNEVLAAGLLLHTGWKGGRTLVDPFCGSGTLVLEAAMIAHDIPPGLFRREFGFMRWGDYEPELFETIRESRMNRLREHSALVHGFDSDFRMISKAGINARESGLEEFCRFALGDFFVRAPWSGLEESGQKEGILVMNPPYGQKLELTDYRFFEHLGDRLKKAYGGWDAWILLPEEVQGIGLKPDRKLKVQNGDIPCVWSRFELFAGSRNQRREAQKGDKPCRIERKRPAAGDDSTQSSE
ncbi:class I SAM-dependent RNA methyltransferase [bacterium]|nr:class I SAM-dependent RNA methyltransferase [bacterium]